MAGEESIELVRALSREREQLFQNSRDRLEVRLLDDSIYGVLVVAGDDVDGRYIVKNSQQCFEEYTREEFDSKFTAKHVDYRNGTRIRQTR